MKAHFRPLLHIVEVTDCYFVFVRLSLVQPQLFFFAAGPGISLYYTVWITWHHVCYWKSYML
jgi:hypothetical protein